jgi:hypothetical protein
MEVSPPFAEREQPAARGCLDDGDHRDHCRTFDPGAFDLRDCR